MPEGFEWNCGKFSQVTKEETDLSFGKYFSAAVTIVSPQWELINTTGYSDEVILL